VAKAAKMITSTMKWRGETLAKFNDARTPAGTVATTLSSVVCSFCEKKPGYHPMRLVGIDNIGRPVMYVAFSQASNCE